MDTFRFDELARLLGHSAARRRLLLGLAGSVAGLATQRSGAVAARKKRKKKPKQPKPNAYGCRSVGVACASAGQCCSGICEGKQGKRTCRAHDTGTCKQDGELKPCNNRTTCGCFRTTAGSDVCAGLFPPSACAACQRDADCLALGFPPGSACGPSAIACESGVMACYVPCGTELPDPETP